MRLDPRLRPLAAVLAIIAALVVRHARAQGGPPMLTDDPGTPGDGKWEINLAALQNRSRDIADSQLPLLDINYGLGERLQLKYEVPREVTRADAATQDHIGDSLFGVKWRFFDEGEAGWQVSTYPQIAFHRSSSPAPAGSPSTLLPIEVELAGKGFDLGVEGGRWVHPAAGASTWIAGLVVGHILGDGLELIGEYHDESSAGWGRSEATLNLGVRFDVSPSCTILASAGRDVHNSLAELQTLIAYGGVQFHL